MRRVIIILFLVLFPLICFAEKIRLEWDPPTDQNITGVKVFQKTAKDGDNYDFSAPVAIVDLNTNFADIEISGEPNAVLKYLWVVRAYRDIYESDNSNEVDYKVVRIAPISPAALQGNYDPEKGAITLSWIQPDDPYPIYKWVVYYRISESDSWIELGSIDSAQDLTLTKAFDAVPDGTKKTVFFSVTAFRRSLTYSTDNAMIGVEIDRLGDNVPPIQNLRININIPVE
jgi:hypothetical protein